MPFAGSELTIAVDAAKDLEGSGKKVRVVSFPSWELFEEQDQVLFFAENTNDPDPAAVKKQLDRLHYLVYAGHWLSLQALRRYKQDSCPEAGAAGWEGRLVRELNSIDFALQSYKDSVLPPDVKARVSLEAGSTFGWLRYVGFEGKAVGIDTFGASGPGPALYEEFGITKQAVVDAVNSL